MAANISSSDDRIIAKLKPQKGLMQLFFLKNQTSEETKIYQLLFNNLGILREGEKADMSSMLL